MMTLSVEVSSTPSLVIVLSSSASLALLIQWLNIVQMRCGLTFSISATRLTGISRSIKANAKASNNKVKHYLGVPRERLPFELCRQSWLCAAPHNGGNRCAQRSSNVATAVLRYHVPDKPHSLHLRSVSLIWNRYADEARYGLIHL